MYKKKKTYSSVEDMIRDTSENTEESREIIDHLAKREITSRLFALRCAKGLSQGDVAKQMNCTQSKISKLESGADEDLRIGDLAAYLCAMEMQLGLVVRKKGTTIGDEVRYHVNCIKRLIEYYTGLADGDAAMSRGILEIVCDNGIKLAKLFCESAKVLIAPLAKIAVEDEPEGECKDDSMPFRQSREAQLALH